MEHQIGYSELSEQARHAWETINGLPLTTTEQHHHAWQVLRDQLPCLADDPRPSLHVVTTETSTPVCDLYLSGPELAALRVMVAWLKARDRSERLRDLPVYPEVAEALLAQLGEMPWSGVWLPQYLDRVPHGGTIVLHLETSAIALARLIEVALDQFRALCPGWPPAARLRLHTLLADVSCWLQAMRVAYA